MFSRLKQLLIKEFIQVLRDKRTRFVLIVPPLAQLLVFGYAASYEIRHVPVAVADYDHSQQSRDFVFRIAASPYFDVRYQLDRGEEVHQLIDQGNATIAIQINSGFAQNLVKGSTARIQVIVDATNSNTALIALGYLNRTTQRFSADYQRERMQRSAPLLSNFVPSIELEQRPLYNVDLHSRWYFVPGIVGSLTMVIVIILTAFAIVREREIGTLEQLMVTPIRPIEFILGKTIPFFLVGLADVSLIATLGTLWFKIPFRGSLAVLAMGTILYMISMLGIGMLISTVSSTQQQAMVTAFFFIMPSIVFSGFGFPISTMPQWLQWATYATPLRYFLIIVRGVYLKGIGLDVLWPQMAGLGAIGISVLALSVLRFRKSVD